jgi:hypothetical protein
VNSNKFNIKNILSNFINIAFSKFIYFVVSYSDDKYNTMLDQKNDSTCSGLNLDNKVWRLPNVYELISPIDVTATSAPNIDISLYPKTIVQGYWSSKEDQLDSTKEIFITFNNNLICIT